MATAVALYNRPMDPKAFDAYYISTHLPLAKKLAGLRSYRISAGPIVTPEGPAPYQMAAILTFESMAALQAALMSPAGQAVVADLGNFATGGVKVLLFDDREV